MKINKKFKLFAVGCMTLLVIVSGFALWHAGIDHENILVADKTDAKILETFNWGSKPEGNVHKLVSFENKSSNAAFLRVSYAETWTKDGVMLNNQVDGKDVAAKHWLNGFGQNSDLWEVGNDGWLYYKRVLPAGKATENMLDYVTFPEYTGAFKEYENADYQLYFRMELLQVSDSASTLNSPEVNKQASTTVFGREAVVSGDVVTWN